MRCQPGTRPITTPRLLLRRFTLADAKPMFDGWASDAQQVHYLLWNPHKTVQESIDFLRPWVARYDEMPPAYRWAVCLKDSGELIGSVSCNFHDGDEDPHPGYVFARSAAGQGYAHEALVGMLAYMVQVAGADVFWAEHAKENAVSGKVLRRVGFVYDHEEVHESNDHTRRWPSLAYRLSAAQFEADIPVTF